MPEDPEEMGQEHLVLQQLLAPPECLEMKDGASSSKTTQATILPRLLHIVEVDAHAKSTGYS